MRELLAMKPTSMSTRSGLEHRSAMRGEVITSLSLFFTWFRIPPSPPKTLSRRTFPLQGDGTRVHQFSDDVDVGGGTDGGGFKSFPVRVVK